MKDVLRRMLGSMKVWTAILWMVLTPAAAWIAKHGWEVNDKTVQTIAEYMTIIFGVLLGSQAVTDHGKEAAKEVTKQLESRQAHEVVMAAAGIPPANSAQTINIEAPQAPIAPAALGTVARRESGFIAPKLMSLIAIIGLLSAPVAITSCGAVGPVPVVVGGVTIDCLVSNRSKIDALLGEFKQLFVGGGIDWAMIYQRAKQAGKDVGGCVIAELVQFYLGGTRAPAPGGGWTAHETLEKFRANEAGGATFLARCTAQDGTVSVCKL